MPLPLLLLLPHAAAGYLWHRFVAWEVARNAQLIAENGAADDLRKGFHQRRGWIRFWWWLALSVGASLPAFYTSYWSFALSLAGLGILLAAYFARYFSPALNLARGLPEFRASSDSASWPDAAIYKRIRAGDFAALPAYWPEVASVRLRQLLTRTWWWGRALYLLALAGLLGLGWVGVK